MAKKTRAGKKAEKQGRRSPLSAMQDQLEYYEALLKEEIAKALLGSREKVDEYSDRVKEICAAMLPYTNARLTPADPTGAGPLISKVIRTVAPSPTVEHWMKDYAPNQDVAEFEKKLKEMHVTTVPTNDTPH